MKVNGIEVDDRDLEELGIEDEGDHDEAMKRYYAEHFAAGEDCGIQSGYRNWGGGRRSRRGSKRAMRRLVG